MPQHIYSNNKGFSKAVKMDMEIDACLEDSLEGYETLFEGGCCHEELFEDRLFSGEMYGLAAAMRSYSELMNEGHGDAGVNLMTMLFRIFQKAGN